jgi:hypothetical protein
MTPEAQRIAIAVIVKRGQFYRPDAHGYTNSIAEAWKLPLAEAKKYEMYADRDDIPGCEKVLIERAPLPDYLNDLNAMAKAEECIPDDKWELYVFNLRTVVYRDNQRPSGQKWCGSDPIHAKAGHRAEAFIQTMEEA